MQVRKEAPTFSHCEATKPMQEDSYQVKQSQQIYQYEFFSEGPKGRIRKVIQFQSTGGYSNLFNLAFGDWDEKRRTINDTVKSNNGDRQKILITIAQTVFTFMKIHPDAMVIAQGSTPSRTRLYQMGIAAFWNEIETNFDVHGLIGSQWEPFTEKRNYQAFLLENK